MSVGPSELSQSSVPVLEIGGTHVTAGLVDADTLTVVSSARVSLDSAAPRQEIMRTLTDAARPLGLHDRWGVAIPGPFDYLAGTGTFAGIGKFDALSGVDLREALSAGIAGRPEVVFINDADAFGVGEAIAGAAAGHRRAVCLTLGTGVGSAFMADGVPVNDGPTVPAEGSAHLLQWNGRPLEETVSRHAIRLRYEQRTGNFLDVREIAGLAREGDDDALTVLREVFTALGSAMAPWIRTFEATILVIGGSIAESLDVVEEPLREGMAAAEPSLSVSLSRPALPGTAALVGAAVHALRTTPTPAAQR